MFFHKAPEFSIVCNATTEQLLTNVTILSWMENVTVVMEKLHVVMAAIHAVMKFAGIDGLDLETAFMYCILVPAVILYIIPWYIMGSLYVNAIIIRFYSEMYNLKDPFDGNPIWQKARRAVSAFWQVQAKLLHGHEVHGLEKLPKDGPGLIVYYHGTLPVDCYYMMARIILDQDRPLCAMTDHFMFSIPGLKFMMEAMGVNRGEPDHCVQLLKDGNLLALAPGGVREALFGDRNYSLIWRNRMGFANVAKKAGVPIFPMFTQNLREVFRTPRIGTRVLKWVYEKTRMPVVLIYGGFPVKLRTYIGDPIYDPNLSAEQLAKKTHDAIEEMIARHQRIPGSIFLALLERII